MKEMLEQIKVSEKRVMDMGRIMSAKLSLNFPDRAHDRRAD